MVLDLARVLGDGVLGLYVGGSLATGDYAAGVSDIDAVALVEQEPGPEARTRLQREHARLARSVEGGAALHCAYVPAAEASDAEREHWTWAFGELFRRPLSGIARAELLQHPVVVIGPEPASWLPPMEPDDLRRAARAELTGYWARAVEKADIWLEDVYVDVGLTVVARADATITQGTLITKSDAIARLPELGVPAEVVAGVAARRRGEQVALTDEERRERAQVVRRFVAAEIDRLVAGSR